MRTIKKKLMCENSKFNIFFEHVVDKVNGLEVKDFLVVEPKTTNKNGISGVALLPIKGRQVGLIKMYRPPIKAWSLEIPHGFIEPGEDEISSAKRELREETGLTADSIIPLGIVAPDAGVINGLVMLFVCEVGGDLQQTTPEVGLGSLIWVGFEDFEQMLRSSEIQDSFTIAAWCKFRLQ
jgi:ADP-ribose pyrophosphatase